MSTLAVNNITDTTGLLPPVFPAGSAQLNPLANREDKIINGDFSVWQRGPNFTSGTHIGYTADRWRLDRLGGFASVSRGDQPPGTTFGGSNPQYYARAGVASQTAPSHIAYLDQTIEGVRSYAGRTITVLGWARRASGSGNFASQVVQSFGTGGTFSGFVAAAPITVALTDAWQPFALTFAVPSITGKSIGTNGNDGLVLRFYLSAGSDFNASTNSLGLQDISVDFSSIHIRQGTWTAAATADYRPRDPGTELTLCQRFYEKSYNIATAPGTNTGLTGSIEDFFMASAMPARVRFAVSKRASPGITTYDAVGNAGTVTTFIPSQTNGQGPTALDNIGNSGFKVFMTQTGLTRMAFHWTADAEL